jgi:cyclophilin family peptidyl-prolyl cis-trans isomerase
MPIVASEKPSDAALLEAAWIVNRMLANRSDILAALGSNRVRLAVMAWNEFTTDLPEHSDLEPAVYWDRRARGLGATRARPAVSCAEENLLCFPGDPYSTENICIHEFAHAIHEMALSVLDPTFEPRLRSAFRAAAAAGLWKGTYAGTNPSEYWAEVVQSWFDDNRQNDALHNHVNTRAELQEYDPAVASLCREVFGDLPWRYKKPMDRPAAERAHLAGLDSSTAPHFKWRMAPLVENPLVLIQTAMGDIEMELFLKQAPVTVTNFVRYVHEGFFSDGAFFRTVTLGNQPDDAARIEVIQARANPAKADLFPDAIRLERTRESGLRHLDGTLSMARTAPDSARDNFFICVGDQPELDFGGKRNPDGQGFAAFGKVTKGMDVVRKIHQSPSDGQQLNPPIRIQRAIRIR